MSSDIKIINFDHIQLPQFLERINTQKGWVDFGIDNLLPQYYQSLLSKSPLHSSIVTQKARLIGGFGFLKTNLSINTMLFLKNSLSENDLDEILYRAAYDLEIYGAFALNIVWSKDRTKIAQIEYVDVAKLRAQAPLKDKKYPQIENYFISDGWENPRKYEPVLYPGFSTNSKQKASQILYVKDQRAGVEYYGIPEYISAIRDMETNYLVSEYHMTTIRDGFSAGVMVSWPIQTASDEERVQLTERFKQQFIGVDGRKVVITFPNSKDESPSFTPIELNDSDTRFLLLDEATQKHILYAHRVGNPAIFGIETPGKLGGRNEILEGLELFQNQYVSPKQNVLEKVFNRLARINGVTDNLIINRYSSELSKITTNTQDVINILTAPITAEQKYYFLTSNGYDRETASNLTGFNNDVKNNNIEDAK